MGYLNQKRPAQNIAAILTIYVQQGSHSVPSYGTTYHNLSPSGTVPSYLSQVRALPISLPLFKGYCYFNCFLFSRFQPHRMVRIPTRSKVLGINRQARFPEVNSRRAHQVRNLSHSDNRL